MTTNDIGCNHYIDHMCNIDRNYIYFEREKKMIIFVKNKKNENDSIIKLMNRIEELERRINVLEMREMQRQRRENDELDFSKKW